MSSKKEEKGAAAERIKAATMSATKGLSRAQAERAAAAATRNVNAYGQKEEGPSRWQERKELKRKMYLLSTEKAVTLGSIKKTVNNSSCQKCYQEGHWTSECKNERVYLSRPTRSQVLKTPKLLQRKMSLYSDDFPEIKEEENRFLSRERNLKPKEEEMKNLKVKEPEKKSKKKSSSSKSRSKSKSKGKSKRRHKSDTSSDSEASKSDSDSRSDYSSDESASSYSSSSDSEDDRKHRKKSSHKKQQKGRRKRYSSSSESSDYDSSSDSESEAESESESDSDSRSSRKKSKTHSRRR